MEKGRSVSVSSFTDGKKTDFGKGLGQRTAYRFPFSDQQTLPGTLSVPSVSTRLCFDSRLATTSIALLQKMGVMTLVRKARYRNFAVKSFGKFRMGTDQFAVKVDAYGQKNGIRKQCEYGIQGKNEAKITAKTAAAAAVAEAVYSTELPQEVYHLEQLFGMTMHEEHLSLTLRGHEEIGPFYEINDIWCWSR